MSPHHTGRLKRPMLLANLLASWKGLLLTSNYVLSNNGQLNSKIYLPKENLNSSTSSIVALLSNPTSTSKPSVLNIFARRPRFVHSLPLPSYSLLSRTPDSLVFCDSYPQSHPNLPMPFLVFAPLFSRLSPVLPSFSVSNLGLSWRTLVFQSISTI